MKIDPARQFWMTAPETRKVMAAPAVRYEQGCVVQILFGGLGHIARPDKKIERRHAD
jgi:hypothetical protein